MNIEYKTFRTDSDCNRDAANALDEVMKNEAPEKSYSQMIRFRLAGHAVKECRDTYFIAMDGAVCVSRLWHGWGMHPDSIGNFGNFRTADSYQRMGIGRKLLELWFYDLTHCRDLPLGLFCTASQPHLVRLYEKYGFRLALKGSEVGPLYCPLGNSPDTFQQFCECYYAPNDSKLRFVPCTTGYRHEIDCLLKFALMDCGENFGLPTFPSCEAAILALAKSPELGVLERIVTDQGHTVGWAYTGQGKSREIQLHPQFRECEIISSN